jgi:hypothetical protein
MAGTGSGLLQPTKLIQTDDFLPAIAPPGYVFHLVSGYPDYVNLSSGGADIASHVIWSVPDGMTVEIVDCGFTPSAATVIASGDGAKISLGKSNPAGATHDYFLDEQVIPTGVAKGASVSIKSADWSFASASNITLESGDQLTMTGVKQSAGGGTCYGTLWARLKWTKKETGSV